MRQLSPQTPRNKNEKGNEKRNLTKSEEANSVKACANETEARNHDRH